MSWITLFLVDAPPNANLLERQYWLLRRDLGMNLSITASYFTKFWHTFFSWGRDRFFTLTWTWKPMDVLILMDVSPNTRMTRSTSPRPPPPCKIGLTSSKVLQFGLEILHWSDASDTRRHTSVRVWATDKWWSVMSFTTTEALDSIKLATSAWEMSNEVDSSNSMPNWMSAIGTGTSDLYGRFSTNVVFGPTAPPGVSLTR